MRVRSGYEDRPVRIEMVPLMDAVFLLLVFFVYAMLSMVVHRGLRVELPAAASAVADRREYVNVTITRDNLILVDRRPVTMDRLAARVTAALAGDPDKPVFISGDERCDFGVAVRALDRLRAANITQVNFECSRPEQ